MEHLRCANCLSIELLAAESLPGPGVGRPYVGRNSGRRLIPVHPARLGAIQPAMARLGRPGMARKAGSIGWPEPGDLSAAVIMDLHYRSAPGRNLCLAAAAGRIGDHLVAKPEKI